MTEQPRVALVGTGVMGEAVLGSLVAAVGAARVTVTDGRPEHGRAVAERHGVAWADDNASAAGGADVVVLAVKPKDVAAVCADLAEALGEGRLVVSVAAGMTTAYLAERLPAGTRVVRVMPNTPATIGRGIAALSGGGASVPADLDLVGGLLAGTGETVQVPESQQDVVTAVSGSGPAYVFYLIEAMRDAGVAGGLDAELALQLARHTVAGAAELALASDDDPTVLRERVTSPGGTTLAAITELDRLEVRDAVGSAVRKAWERAAELGAS
ncbi:pyrroline-5-carboxylate reductase [Pseudactinotalea sp.]|uniref:pyrroline-5-carboxylate reductase n=1 Tax=Pseudactinotalea sp. TaxID=1926260 RepID=UPI003B3BE91D